MVSNGQIPSYALQSVEGWALLAPGCAAAWMAFDSDMLARTGISPSITSPDGAYRSLDRQNYWYSIYKKFGKPVAARPGTSNHGLGMAVDIYNHGAFNRTLLVSVARNHGFLFDTPSESWHVRFTGAANYNPTPITTTASTEDDMTDIIYYATTASTDAAKTIAKEAMYYQEKIGAPIFPFTANKSYATGPYKYEYAAFLARYGKGFDATYNTSRFAITGDELLKLIALRGVATS